MEEKNYSLFKDFTLEGEGEGVSNSTWNRLLNGLLRMAGNFTNVC
jgi:hypothetical protein